MSDQASRLPVSPSLEQLRKQAKELLRAFRSRTGPALERVRTAIPRLADPAHADEFTLVDAQFVIARENGFGSWADLVHHVETSHPRGLAKYERLAEQVARAYMDGDAMAIRNINWTGSSSFVWDHEPERMRRRLPTWYASAARSPELALADARLLVAKQAGLDSWDELVQSVASAARTAERGAIPSATATSFYRIDEGTNSIEVRGPMSEADWDVVFAAMNERGLTTLKGAGQISDAALRRLSRVEHLTSLDVSFAQRLTREGLQHLARLPLRDIELGGWQTQVDDDALEVLQHLPELRTVSLPWAHRVTDRGIANLAGCMRLQSVNLMGTPTGDGSLRALAGKPELVHVDAGTRVTPSGLVVLHEFPMFARRLPDAVLQRARTSDGEPTHLALHPATFADGGLEAIAGLHGIFSLRFFSHDKHPPITGAALEPVVGLEGLHSLWCDPTDDAMAVIARMPRLRNLMCQDTRAGDDGWVALARSRTIERIWGRRNDSLSGRGLTALSAMPSLRTLGVNLRNVEDAQLASLATFPALRELTPIGLGDRAFRHVGACTKLETLTCMYTADIGDAAMEQITGLLNLRRYYAGDVSISDRSLDVLGALPSLESVELWNCLGITDAGLATLARAPHLREVVLDGVPAVTRAAITLFPPHVRVRITS